MKMKSDDGDYSCGVGDSNINGGGDDGGGGD